MELKFSPLSPYVRKVSVTAHELGIAQRIRLTPVKTREEPDKIAPFNPLGKIPTLVTDAGAVLYDSPVICEYLDAEFGNHRLLPASGARRWDILTRVALADGMMDAAILRPHRAVAGRGKAIERPDRVAAAGLDRVAAAEGPRRARPHGRLGRRRSASRWTWGRSRSACALGYMPLRVAELEGLPKWPRLKAWYDALSQRDSFRLTKPVL